jgi:hypothetical protein
MMTILSASCNRSWRYDVMQRWMLVGMMAVVGWTTVVVVVAPRIAVWQTKLRWLLCKRCNRVVLPLIKYKRLICVEISMMLSMIITMEARGCSDGRPHNVLVEAIDRRMLPRLLCSFGLHLQRVSLVAIIITTIVIIKNVLSHPMGL